MVIDYRGSEKRKRQPLLILCDLHVHATLNRDQLVSYQTTAADGLHHRYADRGSEDFTVKILASGWSRCCMNFNTTI